MRLSIIALALASTALPAFGQEVNLYSHRQPELIQPLMDAFTAETGIAVNIAFVDKGMTERLVAEGDRSPADLVLTVDIARLTEVVGAGVTQAVQSDILEANIPADYRDPADHWFALTTRARIVYASKDRVAPGEVTSYEDLASAKWKGRICTRSGTNDYNVALTSAYLAHHTPEATQVCLEERQSGAQTRGRRPRSDQGDLGRRMRYRHRQHLLHRSNAV
jgi:iron(III) transport system substrate-binding protein